MESDKIKRKNKNTTIDSSLWFYLSLLSANMSTESNKIHINKLLESGIVHIINKHAHYLPDEQYKAFQELCKDRKWP